MDESIVPIDQVINDTRYGLAKQVPDMERGFSISTNYGDLFIYPGEAELVMKVVNLILENRLKDALGSAPSTR